MPATPLQDGFERLAQLASDDPNNEALRKDLPAAFNRVNGWSPETIEWQGQPAISGLMVFRAGKHYGPYSSNAARQALGEGVLRQEDHAWDTASRQWSTLGKILGLDSQPEPALAQPQPSQSDLLIYRNEQESVAYSPAEANAAVARGELRPDDWAWNDSIKDWVPLRTLLVIPAPPVPPIAEAVAPEPALVVPTDRPQPALPATVEEARQRLSLLNEDKELLEKKVSGLEKHLAQALKACASLDRLKDELASAQQHARERMAEVEARGREASSWQVKASESEAALAGVREENTELRARVAASQRAYTDLETRLQGTGKLQAELERHQREASAARLRADAAAADLTAAREESARHRAEADKLRSDIAAGEKRIHQLETQAAIAEDLARRCKEAADLLEKARSCLQAR